MLWCGDSLAVMTGINPDAPIGTKLAFVEYGGYLYTSTDSGATWTPRMTDAYRSWFAIASSSDGAKLVAFVYGGYIYTSTDSGATWTQR